MSHRTAYQDALKMLAARSHSIYELKAKLLRREWPAADVQAAVERLQDQGLLDDREFAVQWAEQRSRLKRYGPERIKLELLSKGIDRRIAETVVDELFSGLDIRSRAAEVARQAATRWRNMEETALRKRLLNFLLRRGYSREESQRAIETCLTDIFSDR